MAFKKSDEVAHEEIAFDSLEEAESAFKSNSNEIDNRLAAFEYILKVKDALHLLKMLNDNFKENRVEDHPLIDFAFTNIKTLPKSEELFDQIFEMLSSDNAYIRNAAIKFLQEYGLEAKPYLEKLMNSEDKDIRIFAINVLGDVRYDDSVDMLRYFVLKEKDVNAMMTAVDYLGEIGSEEDIKLLEALKEEHKDEPYVVFGIDTAIERIKG
jgi:HEAT repeat protein